MEYRDYYKILGVSKSATTDEIKRQYRKLARKYHPDVNPGDNKAAARFAEINEAHEVLSDPEKRKKYDTLGSNWEQYENVGQDSPFTNRKAYGNGSGYTVFEGDMDDLFGGAGFSDFFKTFFGDTFSGFRSHSKSYSSKGHDYKAELEISLEEAYSGCVKVIQVNNQTLRITLEPGIMDGRTIKLKGKGGAGANGGKKGDLYITIRIPPHPLYKRVDNDLYIEVPVSMYTMLLGGEKEINALSGRFKIKIPPETENGTAFRLKGKGFPADKKSVSCGDLYVKVMMETPKNLSDREKSLIRELARMRS
ncbi:MAG: J domain-containing protein [Spirochaetales bacterium]|nr:J domain-containing protein [Spirochaetales bacterium]